MNSVYLTRAGLIFLSCFFTTDLRILHPRGDSVAKIGTFLETSKFSSDFFIIGPGLFHLSLSFKQPRCLYLHGECKKAPTMPKPSPRAPEGGCSPPGRHLDILKYIFIFFTGRGFLFGAKVYPAPFLYAKVRNKSLTAKDEVCEECRQQCNKSVCTRCGKEF